MTENFKISVPETEGWIGKNLNNTFFSYQQTEYNNAIEKVNRFRTALDLGANVGMMSYRMVKQFAFVHAFEPLFHEHVVKNVRSNNIQVHPYAVGAEEKTETMRVGMYHSGGSNIVGDTIMDRRSAERNISQTYQDVQVKTVDSYQFNNVDFIKIDVEEYEWYVLQGAAETIETYKPVVLIELKRYNKHYNKILNFFNNYQYKREIVGELDSVFY